MQSSITDYMRAAEAYLDDIVAQKKSHDRAMKKFKRK